MASGASDKLLVLDANSPELHLSHPTPKECEEIWTNTSSAWGDSLSLPVYLEESHFLTTVPLANDGGMTSWVLVDKNLPPDQRQILCSCESFRKRALTCGAEGNVTEGIIHGIASVFCPPAYRGRGYAARMMTELAQSLRTWQSDSGRCIGSILYSDIGKEYYAKLGWRPNPTNSHVVFQPSATINPPLAQQVPVEDIAELCHRDEVMIRKAMARSAQRNETVVTVVPDLDHMLWHIGKEEFACKQLFGKVPQAKGAIAGSPGHQVWALWTHRYYGHPDSDASENTLYILRLVVEGRGLENDGEDVVEKKKLLREEDYHRQTACLKAVIEAAQAEAAEWKLDQVKLWHPSQEVRDMIIEAGIEHLQVERQQESIASGLWYDAEGAEGTAPRWLNNEHYAWC